MNSLSRRTSIALRTTLMSVVTLLLCFPASAQEPESAAPAGTEAAKVTAPATKASMTDLVAAAEKSRAKRAAAKPGTRKKITNADVKKSKGRLIFISEAPAPKGETSAAEPEGTADERELARNETRRHAHERLAKATQAVEDLTFELVSIEQRYYESNDATHRDTVLKGQFEETKRELEAARVELEAARAALPDAEAAPRQ